jgi:hypothetical protein
MSREVGNIGSMNDFCNKQLVARARTELYDLSVGMLVCPSGRRLYDGQGQKGMRYDKHI